MVKKKVTKKTVKKKTLPKSLPFLVLWGNSDFSIYIAANKDEVRELVDEDEHVDEGADAIQDIIALDYFVAHFGVDKKGDTSLLAVDKATEDLIESFIEDADEDVDEDDEDEDEEDEEDEEEEDDEDEDE